MNIVKVHKTDIKVDITGLDKTTIARIENGRYEGASRKLCAKVLDPSLPFLELGGCMGVQANETDPNLDNPELHVVVEASPWVCELNERNKKLNNSKYTIINKAIHGSLESVSFRVPEKGQEFIMTGSVVLPGSKRIRYPNGVVGEMGTNVVEVPATNVTKLINDIGWDEAAILCDIEGSEFNLLMEDMEAFVDRCPWLVIEWHPKSRKKGFGYRKNLHKQLCENKEFVPEASNNANMTFYRNK